MANKNLRALGKVAFVAIAFGTLFAVACGDNSSNDNNPTPPATGGGNTGGGNTGGGNTGGGNTGGGNTGGMGGMGGVPVSMESCFSDETHSCYILSDKCVPQNSDEFKNAQPSCPGTCPEHFDNGTLTKLVNGKVPPLDQ